MRVTTPDGRSVRVRRRWLPWRPRLRKVDEIPDPGFGVDDLVIGIIILAVFLVLLIVAPVILAGAFLLVEVLLAVLLMPLFILARIALGRPWTIEAVENHRVLGTERVRGWNAATVRITEIANAYERGSDPFQQAATIGSE